MIHSSIFLSTMINFEKDCLFNFIREFTFKPNNFDHQVATSPIYCMDRIIGDYEIIYFIGGTGYVTIDKREYKCKAGDLIVIPPFTLHSIWTTQPDLHNNYWVHFDVSPFYKQDEFYKIILNGNKNKINIGMNEKLLKLYEALENEMQNKSLGYWIFFNTILQQIITLVIRFTNENRAVEFENNAFSNEKLSTEGITTEADDRLTTATAERLTTKAADGLATATADGSIVEKSIEYINMNLSNKICVSDICKYVHVSESLLFKSFMKIAKLPPNRMIQLLKIKKAEQMMKTSSMSFKEISELLGFSSPYYFSSVFKKIYNASPKEYLKKINY